MLLTLKYKEGNKGEKLILEMVLKAKQSKMLKDYIKLLKQWSKTVNLVQRETLADVKTRHINDCKQLRKYLAADDYIIDIGSGAGLPGVILAILGYKNVILCEKDYKKCIFLHDVRCTLSLFYKIHNGDIFKYEIPDEKQRKAVCVARAFASLEKLVSVMEKLNVSRGIFHKGKMYMREINEAKKRHNFEYTAYPSETNEHSMIIEIRRV